MNYQKLKELLEGLTEGQLNQPVIFFKGDEETGNEIDFVEVSIEDQYFMEGDAYGDEKNTRENYEGDFDADIDEFTCVKAGTVTLHSDI